MTHRVLYWHSYIRWSDRDARRRYTDQAQACQYNSGIYPTSISNARWRTSAMYDLYAFICLYMHLFDRWLKLSLKVFGWYLKHITKHRRPPFCVVLSSFLFLFSSDAYKSHGLMNRHRSMLSRRVLRQGYAFWGLEYLVFIFLPICHPKSSKLRTK